MKFTTTSHALTATSAGAVQALSADCAKVSIIASAAMDFNVVPGTEGTLTVATVTAAATDVKEKKSITTAGRFGVGDVLRISVASNNEDYTVTSDDPAVTASEIKDDLLADTTIAGLVDVTVSGNVITLERKVANTAFTLTATYQSRQVNHAIAANERLELEVPAGSNIRAKASSGTLDISELE